MDWQSPQVKDLAWLLGSPPLLTPHGDARWPSAQFFHEQLALSLPLLQQLDAQPQALQDFIEAHSVRRLGIYAEQLLSFWLRHPDNPHYTLIAEHLAIRDAQQTLGELDYLVWNKPLQQVEHWELAVKFYLGRPASEPEAVWVGPGLRDTLARKYHHLVAQQLCWSEQAAGQAVIQHALTAAGLDAQQPIHVRCWMKGRLFYPAQLAPVAPPAQACSEHERGSWHIGEVPEQRPNLHERLHRQQWTVLPGWGQQPIVLR